MAKLSVIHRNLRRIKDSINGKKYRQELRKIANNPDDFDAQQQAQKILQRHRNKSSVRVCNRCSRCGRGKGVYRKFGMCRICMRQDVMSGKCAGVRKSSW